MLSMPLVSSYVRVCERYPLHVLAASGSGLRRGATMTPDGVRSSSNVEAARQSNEDDRAIGDADPASPHSCASDLVRSVLFGAMQHTSRGNSGPAAGEYLRQHGICEGSGAVEKFINHVFRGECMVTSGSDGDACCLARSLWSSRGSMLSDVSTGLSMLANDEQFSIASLVFVCSVFGIRIAPDLPAPDRRRRGIAMLQELMLSCTVSDDRPETAMFAGFERLSKSALQSLMHAHGIVYSRSATADNLREMFVAHVTAGACDTGVGNGCANVRVEFVDQSKHTDLRLYVLSSLKRPGAISINSMRRVLAANGVEYERSETLAALRRRLKVLIRDLRRGKRCERDVEQRAREVENDAERLRSIRENWPQRLSSEMKEKLLEAFRQETSSESVKQFTCACCAARYPSIRRRDRALTDINIDLLKRSGSTYWSARQDPVTEDQNMESARAVATQAFPMPMQGILPDVFLHPDGVYNDCVNGIDTMMVSLCKKCCSTLDRNKLPALSLANGTYLGDVPPELKDLTPVEESMIALCRTKCWILQLKEADSHSTLPGVQRGVRGHIIIHPQHPEKTETTLPLTLDEAAKPICVVFVGSKSPTKEWLKEKAVPLSVRRDKIKRALVWLKENNVLYRDILVDEGRIDSLPENDIVPVDVQHVQPSAGQDALTSAYENGGGVLREGATGDPTSSFESVVITDVEGNAPPDKLRAAALRHFKRGGGYVEMQHDYLPENEFFNPVLFPKAYPTLFPYGVGGFEDRDRPVALSMKHHVKHLLNLGDVRFQEHYSFMFTAFNVLQRRAVLLHTSLKIKRESYRKVSAELATVSADAILRVCQKLEETSANRTFDDEERRVLKLMREVNFVSRNVPASASARVAMRDEIRSLILRLGLPSFFITINPADIYNPLVRALAGSDIDIDDLLPDQVTDPVKQSILIAKNPVVAAKFFNLMIKAFVKCILGYDDKKISQGLFGVVSGFYGCVEAQGRGSLHCHMLIWVEGGLNSDEIMNRVHNLGDDAFAARLVDFLDDTISTSVPVDPADVDVSLCNWKDGKPPHPCSIRNIIAARERGSLSDAVKHTARAHDFRRLVDVCQWHRHSSTCFKYCKPGAPRQCRFELDSENVRQSTAFDPDTGELYLRKLDSLVNNFNDTMLEALRNNIDVKFIASGEAAKAVLYYITNYVAKAQLKTHVAYAALELAARKLDKYHADETDSQRRARMLLRKCVYQTLANQELSAPQVASYNLDLEDHFTNFRFRRLFWRQAERYVELLQPSPECAVRHSQVSASAAADDDIDNASAAGDAEQWDDDFGAEDVEESAQEQVTVTVDRATGGVRPHSGQLEDYLFRDTVLRDMSLWQYIERGDKLFKLQRSSGDSPEDVDNDDEMDDDAQSDVDDTAVDNELADASFATPLQDILTTRTRSRPSFEFCEGHLERGRKVLRISHPNERRAVVPVGGMLPRRDRPDIYARYCRLMLILFKPWVDVSDLREQDMSWEDAFAQFITNASEYIRSVVNNMQLFHECKASGEERMRTGKHRGVHGVPVGQDGRHHEAATADESQAYDHDDLMEHLGALEDLTSPRRVTMDRDTLDCLRVAEDFDIFQSMRISALGAERDTLREVLVSDIPQTAGYEDEWKTVYEQRKDSWKQKESGSTDSRNQSQDDSQHAQGEVNI